MKTKILSVLLGLSIMLMTILGIYTVNVQPICKRIHIGKLDRSREIIYLDEEMAREIADLVLGIEKDEEDTDYEVETVFDEQRNEWVVRYVPEIEEGSDGEHESMTVRIRKDNGIITLDSSR